MTTDAERIAHWEKRVFRGIFATYAVWFGHVVFGVVALIVVVSIFIIAVGIRVVEDGERLRTGRPF